MIFHEARELWRSLKTVHLYILWLLTLNAYHILWGGRGEEWKHSKLSEKPFFSHPGNLARTEKCLKGFMISAHCTLHTVQTNQAHRPSHHMRTTNKQQILAEFLRCAHVYKHQDQLRQNVWCVTPHPLFYLPHNCLIHKGYQESQQKHQETGGCNWTVFLDETQFLTIS